MSTHLQSLLHQLDRLLLSGDDPAQIVRGIGDELERLRAVEATARWYAQHPARNTACGVPATPDRVKRYATPKPPVRGKTARELFLPPVGGIGWE